MQEVERLRKHSRGSVVETTVLSMKLVHMPDNYILYTLLLGSAPLMEKRKKI